MKPFHIFLLFFVLLTLSSASCEFDSKPKAASEATIASKNTTQKFLFLSDIHLNTDSLNTTYGWDTGMKLWDAFLAKADSVIVAEKPNFIVYTGDLPAHYDAASFFLPKPLRANHNKNIATILEGLRKLADQQKTPLFYLPGNNDAIAGDYFSFTDEDGDTPLSLIPEKKNPYPGLNIDSTGTAPPFIIDDKNLKKGYYSAQLADGLRLIALNTVIYSRHYQNVDGGTQLGYGDAQMNWLDQQLKDAKTAGDKAYVAMHIPPGNDAYGVTHQKYPYNWVGQKPSGTGNWNNDFLKVIANHTPTITGILYGHTHMDELRRLYDPSGNTITEVAISCPGVTPQHYNNPGFKIVTYDIVSKELLDFTTYHTIPSATIWGAATYNFNSEFRYASSNTLYENLSKDNFDSIHVKLNKIYTVKNGKPDYDIKSGIEVKTEN